MDGGKHIAVYVGPKVEAGGMCNFLLQHKIRFATYDEKDMREGAFMGHRAVVCPGGGMPDLSAKAEKNLKSFISQGGGYIGVCIGLSFAHRIKLLPFEVIGVNGIGPHQIFPCKRHPVTKGYALLPVRGKPRKGPGAGIRITRYNGQFVVPNDSIELLATYDRGMKLGAIVAGRFGKGKVVLFSPHPEKSVAPPEGWEKQTWPAPGKLLVNAVAYVMGG